MGRGPGADIVVPDRSMSRRHLLLRVEDDDVTVADLDSSNGTFVEGEGVVEERELVAGEALEAGRSVMRVESSSATERAGATALARGRVAFNRPPRVARPQPEPLPATIAVPGGGEPARVPLGAAPVPLAIGGTMAAVTRNPALLSFALLTPAMAVWSHVEGRRSGVRRRGGEVAEFRREIADLGERLRRARQAEIDQRRDAAPDAVTLRRWAATLAPRLWERRPHDPDFIELRVGTGDLQPTARVVPAPGGAPELREEALSALEPDARLPAVPVTVGLAGGVLGLAGPPAAVASLARLLVVQAAALHSPAELDVAVVLPEAEPEWEWAKWLPHTQRGAVTAGSTTARELLEELRGRRALGARGDRRQAARSSPRCSRGRPRAEAA